MPATTTRQSAPANRSRASSSRCRPATPTSSIRSTPAPCTATVSAASAATGASEVPALITATRPRAVRDRPQGRGPGDLVDDASGQLGAHDGRSPPRRAGWPARPGRDAARAGCAGSPTTWLGRLAARRRPPPDPRCARPGRRRRGRSRGRRCALRRRSGGFGHATQTSRSRARSLRDVAGVLARVGTAWSRPSYIRCVTRPSRRVLEVVAVVHPDPGVVGQERDVEGLAVLRPRGSRTTTGCRWP